MLKVELDSSDDHLEQLILPLLDQNHLVFQGMCLEMDDEEATQDDFKINLKNLVDSFFKHELGIYTLALKGNYQITTGLVSALEDVLQPYKIKLVLL
jgi:hypothetical protein